MSELLNADQERDGHLTMNAKGFGFVKIGDGFPDVFIPPAHTGGALQGEKVRVRFTLDETGRALGQIIAIDAPAAPVFVGRLGTVNGAHRVIHPLDPRWPARVRLSVGVTQPDGTLVQARLTTRPCGHIHAQAHIEAFSGSP